MYSRVSAGFFNGGIRSTTIPRRHFATRQHFSQIARNPIFMALYNQNELADNKAQLRQKIQKTENQLINVQQKLKSYQDEERLLTEPSRCYEQTRENISEMTTKIVNGAYKALIHGKTTMVDGPSWGYDTDLLDFFKPLLSVYGITMERTSELGQGESYEFLHIKFPKDFSKSSIPDSEGNTEYKKILDAFGDELRIAYLNANCEINTHLAILKRELLEPITNDKPLALSRANPCPAAYKLLEELASKQNISLSKQGDVIIAESQNLESDDRYQFASPIG